MLNLRNFLLVFFVSCLFLGQAQEMGFFTDTRDQQVYKTVTLDIILEGDVTIKRIWMAQNLNYEMRDSFCYKNEPAYCEVYGRLYTFKQQ